MDSTNPFTAYGYRFTVEGKAEGGERIMGSSSEASEVSKKSCRLHAARPRVFARFIGGPGNEQPATDNRQPAAGSIILSRKSGGIGPPVFTRSGLFSGTFFALNSGNGLAR